jgi:cytosine/adenosine deaminase-related metal-dependent hydrolase
VAVLAREQDLPIAVHVAESAAETQLVVSGTGPFAEAWTARGIPLLDDPRHSPAARSPTAPARTPVAWLDAHGVLAPGTLCIHAIRISEADIRLLAERGVAIAHCPVSNAAHGHGAAPLAALRQAGIRVGIGTDSVASVGALDLLREARAAQALAGLDAAAALALATLEGARALGLEAELGSLTVGKWADLAVVAPAAGQAPGEPLHAALHASPADVVLTLLGGRIVHRTAPA